MRFFFELIIISSLPVPFRWAFRIKAGTADKIIEKQTIRTFLKPGTGGILSLDVMTLGCRTEVKILPGFYREDGNGWPERKLNNER